MRTLGLALDDQQAASRFEDSEALGDAQICVLPVMERVDRPHPIEGAGLEGQVLGTGRGELDVRETPGPPPGDLDHRRAAIDTHCPGN